MILTTYISGESRAVTKSNVRNEMTDIDLQVTLDHDRASGHGKDKLERFAQKNVVNPKGWQFGDRSIFVPPGVPPPAEWSSPKEMSVTLFRTSLLRIALTARN